MSGNGIRRLSARGRLGAGSGRLTRGETEASVHPLRTRAGRHETDVILERDDGRIVAVDITLGRMAGHEDIEHLARLNERGGEVVLNAVRVTTAPTVYQRKDGTGVVPAAVLTARLPVSESVVRSTYAHR